MTPLFRAPECECAQKTVLIRDKGTKRRQLRHTLIFVTCTGCVKISYSVPQTVQSLFNSAKICPYVCGCVCVRGMKMLLQKKNSNDLNRASAVFTLCSLSLEVVTSLFSMSFAALYIFDDSGLPQNRVTTRKITSVRVSPHCTGCTALHPLSRKVSMYDIHKSRPP